MFVSLFFGLLLKRCDCSPDWPDKAADFLMSKFQNGDLDDRETAIHHLKEKTRERDKKGVSESLD